MEKLIVPAEVQDMTAEWFSQMLSAKSKRAVDVTSVQYKRALAPGENYGSSCWIFDIKAAADETNRSKKTYSLFVKTLSELEMIREHTFKSGIFDRETVAYRDVIPMLMEFQHNNGDRVYKLSAPELFYGGVDSERKAACILLKNIKETGYTMQDRYEGFTIDHTRALLTQLARLHGLSIAMINKKLLNVQERFPMLSEGLMGKNFGDDPTTAQMIEEVKSCTARYKFILRNEPDHEVLDNKIDKLFENIGETFRELFNPPADDYKGIITLIHGDCWINNILFKHNKDGKIEDVMMVDFQGMRYTTPMYDLVYMFYISLRGELRRKHLVDLLKFYHTELQQVTGYYGVNLNEIGYSFDEMKADFKKQQPLAVTFGVMIVNTIASKAMNQSMAGKNMEDIKKIQDDEIFNETNPELNQRIRDIYVEVLNEDPF